MEAGQRRRTFVVGKRLTETSPADSLQLFARPPGGHASLLPDHLRELRLHGFFHYGEHSIQLPVPGRSADRSRQSREQSIMPTLSTTDRNQTIIDPKDRSADSPC